MLSLFYPFEGRDGMIGFMQIDDNSDALIGSEFEFLRKTARPLKLSSQGDGVFALQKQLNLSEFELLW